MTTHIQETTGTTQTEAVPLRRRLARSGLVLGPLLIGVGAVITPESGDDGESLVATASESAGSWTAGHLTVIAGAALLLVGLASLAAYLPRRARTATVGLSASAPGSGRRASTSRRR